MAALLIGYARCSSDPQDLTAQHDGLTALGVSPGRIYVDHGLTGTARDRPRSSPRVWCHAASAWVKWARPARCLVSVRQIVGGAAWGRPRRTTML
jgi:Resolvase, N terminal domain